VSRSFAGAPAAQQGPAQARETGAAPRRRFPLRLLGPRFRRGLAGVAFLLLIGEVIGRAGLVDRSFLPPPSAVLARVVGLLGNSAFRTDVAVTLQAWAAGLLLALVCAVPVGLLLGSLPIVSSAARALVEFLRPIPSVALIPLALLVFADQGQMEFLLAAYGAFWPILINTMYSVGEVDPMALEVARSFGLGRFVILTRVVLPSVAPFVATGTRVASAIALIIPISTEMIAGGDHGIGIFVLTASGVSGQADVVFAAVAIAGAIGYLIDLILRRAERRLFRWHFARLGVNP